jgi:KUP system potassium uptake protein
MNPQNSEVEISEQITDHLDQKMLPSLTANFPKDAKLHQKESLALLTLTAMGVVFGDIGTSPLYALRECFLGEHAFLPTTENIYGILSLFFWSLTIVISIKYVIFIMRADNRGEGGILALEALAKQFYMVDSEGLQGTEKKETPFGKIILLVGLFGASLLYGDGVITPAISVLSALEGLSVATPIFEPYIVWLTILVLFFLFLVQRNGTAKIGMVFGPLTILWFGILFALGLKEILHQPSILNAMNPQYAWQFFQSNGLAGYLILGTVFLCVTGGEAMYADMGHFGKKPIRVGWFLIAMPALIVNYFGQGALILRNPSAIANPFYKMVPDWGLYPVIFLATCATVIASQALISGVFSLARQSVQFGYIPRVYIQHTSKTEIGQIYVPTLNWLLFAGSALLVLALRSSSAIAHAYGIAVSLTMFITTLLAMLVAKHLWKWHWSLVVLLFVPLLCIDTAFFSTNLIKILHGGWIPISLAIAIQIIMTTWISGRKLFAIVMRRYSEKFGSLLEDIQKKQIHKIEGTAVFLTTGFKNVPQALMNHLRHNHVLHKRVIFLNLYVHDYPTMSEQPFEYVNLKNGFHFLRIHIGFMDAPNVPALLNLWNTLHAQHFHLVLDPNQMVFFLGKESILATDDQKGMLFWRERLFAMLSLGASSPSDYFQLPPDQVIEMGLQLKI